MSQTNIGSFLNLELVIEGEESSRFLQIPTEWDEDAQIWHTILRLPQSKKIITSTGKDFGELQDKFNIELSKLFKDEKYCIEVFDMFRLKEES